MSRPEKAQNVNAQFEIPALENLYDESEPGSDSDQAFSEFKKSVLEGCNQASRKAPGPLAGVCLCVCV